MGTLGTWLLIGYERLNSHPLTKVLRRLLNTDFKVLLLNSIEALKEEEEHNDALIETLEKIVHKQLTKYCFKENVVKEIQSLYMPESVDD
jgi:hypothetical protein